MAVVITGPTSLTIPSGSLSISQDYEASKPVTWSLTSVSSNLPAGSYTATIDSSGLLTISIQPGTAIPPGGATFSVVVHAVHRGGDTGSLAVTVSGPPAPCFVTGTLITTARGEIAVEALETGDVIVTHDGEHLPLRHVVRQSVPVDRLQVDASVRPVRIAKGAFGDVPRRDLLVSPMHRILVQGWAVELCCGAERVLAHALHMVDGKQITQDRPNAAVVYHHLLLDRHAIIFSEGLATESMFLGEMIAHMLPEPDLLAIEAMIGRRLADAALAHPQTSYRCATRSEAAQIAALRKAA